MVWNKRMTLMERVGLQDGSSDSGMVKARRQNCRYWRSLLSCRLKGSCQSLLGCAGCPAVTGSVYGVPDFYTREVQWFANILSFSAQFPIIWQIGMLAGISFFVRSGQGYAVIGGTAKPGFRPYYRDEGFFMLQGTASLILWKMFVFAVLPRKRR